MREALAGAIGNVFSQRLSSLGLFRRLCSCAIGSMMLGGALQLRVGAQPRLGGKRGVACAARAPKRQAVPAEPEAPAPSVRPEYQPGLIADPNYVSVHACRDCCRPRPSGPCAAALGWDGVCSTDAGRTGCGGCLGGL